MVLRAGLEPARITPHAPQTCAATNYATSAIRFQRNYLFAGTFALDAGAVLAAAEFAAASSNEFVAGVSISALLELSTAILVFAGSVCCSTTDSSAGISALLRTEIFPLSAGIEIS